ncbi:AraC-like DNA-binding protein [Ereboglobus sp. PH5-5]|uniref:AraC family transcriptional regulator n=1 Tax=Ereboglobus sp. PH5-5 TaxID=2940529 RepID=UPI002406FC50|nr:AraC family transcriptional regulator [Ereboglobus sp. PH5-5]MDF9832318.1 AraC-like DNA-binding protein [Ereboglobus sp. PH5-5]
MFNSFCEIAHAFKFVQREFYKDTGGISGIPCRHSGHPVPTPAPSHEKTPRAARNGGGNGILQRMAPAQRLIESAGKWHRIIVMPEKHTDAQIDWMDKNDDVLGSVTVRGQCAVFIARHTSHVLVLKQETTLLRFRVEDDAALWRQSVCPQPLEGIECRPLWKLARRDKGIMDLINLLIGSNATFPESYFHHLGAVLSYHLIDALHHENETAPATMDAERLNRVLDYIEQNLHGRISIETLADVACMSLSHFKRLFKAGTGMTGRDYVFRERIRRAQTLLRQGRLRISEVAAHCGFSDQSHLDRCFRRHCQCTPGEFLKMSRSSPKMSQPSNSSGKK